MRIALSVVFSLLIIALVVCMMLAQHSKNPVSKSVSYVLLCTAIPVLGNLVLIFSSDSYMAFIGFNVYFLGMDATVLSLWHFTHDYCEMGPPKPFLKTLIYSAFGIDFLQYIVNAFTGHAFSYEQILVEDRAYFRVVPYYGQAYHRLICYGLFIAVLIILYIKSRKASKVYAEKYWIIFFSLLATCAVETYYVFSRQPMDVSMIGLGFLGLLIYFFALHYRPLKLLDRMLAGVASDMPDALFFFDESGKCIWINDPGKKLIGINNDNYDDVKDNLKFLFGDLDFDSSGWFRRITMGTGDETQYSYLAMRSIADEKGKVTGSYLSIRDITEEQREMKREMYRSTHDSLTGLYTKEYLYENIEKRLNDDHESDYMIGYIEVSNYKVLNDVFGKKFAELAIKKIADFIDKGTSQKCIYGRLSDDSFGILLDKPTFKDERVEGILESFTVKDDNLEHHILMHFGIYDIDPDEAIDVPLFFDSARLAATMVHDDYQRFVVYYDDKLRNEIIHDQMISNQLKNAIETKQIRPYLQPIMDSQGLVAGAEALVRWIHPDEGFMNPGMFIPAFERNGLISEVDRYMWRSVCEILSDWKSRNIDCFISVNISPKDFYYMDVVSELKNLVEEFGIDPVKLRVEITETAMITGAVDILKTAVELRKSGFIVEMDDFGSGYSSLNLLKDMDIDVIKIDMQFLKDSERNPKANTIIKSIISMAENLEIDTLTEGVETAKQFEKLYQMGCKLYQGYYFSKPVPVEDFEKQWFD